MEQSSISLDASPEIPLASRRSLLFRFAVVALCLPTAIVLIDHLTWMNRWLWTSQEAIQRFFFLWMIVKTAMLAACAGRLFGTTLYGWIILLWGVALIDVHTYGASHGLFGSSDVNGLVHTLVSAQAGFLALWAILGKTAAAWRIAAGILAAAAILFHASVLSMGWRQDSLTAVQTIAALILATLCVSLRIAGFRLQQINTSVEDGATNQREIFQFGMKDMLIWTTALAPLLVVMKGIDWIIYRQLGIVDLYPAALISTCTAFITLATIWLTLGKGKLFLRLAFFTIAIVTAALTMYTRNAQWLAIYGQWPDEPVIGMSIRMGNLWGVWFGLVSGLLAALLVFFRAAGLRLVKPSRSVSA
jgi:hypothetical protein